MSCHIAPLKGEKYSAEDITLEIRKENISSKDSYESCVKRMEASPYLPGGSYISELERIESLFWRGVPTAPYQGIANQAAKKKLTKKKKIVKK